MMFGVGVAGSGEEEADAHPVKSNINSKVKSDVLILVFLSSSFYFQNKKDSPADGRVFCCPNGQVLLLVARFTDAADPADIFAHAR